MSAANGVLANDTDPDGDTLTAVKASDPLNGSVTLNADGSFTYIPNANFDETDSFTYYLSDGLAQSNIATVTVTVNPINDDPVITPPDEQTSSEGDPISLQIVASDVDGDPLRFDASGLPAYLSASSGK